MRPFGLSAFVRCKNEEEFIVASIASCYRVFDEIVVILNNSTDRTGEFVRDLMTDHPRIRLVNYPLACASIGPGYLEEVKKSPERSLARYYNWCLEQTTYSHVCKWDGDMIALPPFERVRDLLSSSDVVSFDGYDVLGRATTSPESRIFRYDSRHTRYEDWDLYEVLKHEHKKVSLFEAKCYLHMKLVKRDWLHREWVSPNDFATKSVPAPGSSSTAIDRISSPRFPIRDILRRMLWWRRI